jgi:hypothetical protein
MAMPGADAEARTSPGAAVRGGPGTDGIADEARVRGHEQPVLRRAEVERRGAREEPPLPRRRDQPERRVLGRVDDRPVGQRREVVDALVADRDAHALAAATILPAKERGRPRADVVAGGVEALAVRRPGDRDETPLAPVRGDEQPRREIVPGEHRHRRRIRESDREGFAVRREPHRDRPASAGDLPTRMDRELRRVEPGEAVERDRRDPPVGRDVDLHELVAVLLVRGDDRAVGEPQYA